MNETGSISPDVKRHLACVDEIKRELAAFLSRQSRAQTMAQTAHKRGSLPKPDVCEQCKKPPTVIEYDKAFDIFGDAKKIPRRPTYLSFHHTEGYGPGKELVGTWLCHGCHRDSRHQEREAIDSTIRWNVSYGHSSTSSRS